MQANVIILLVLTVTVLCALGAAPVTAISPSTGAPAIEWQQLLGGSEDEFATHMSVQPTVDGGYVLLGFTQSSGTGNVTGMTHGLDDVWVVKLNGTGAVQWDRLLGGNGYDYARAIERTNDGGYILLATSDSSGSGDVTGTTHGGRDLWVVKLDGTGAIQWDRLLGGDNTENAVSIQQTSDGGYIVLGDSGSSGTGDVTGTAHGSSDLWVVKLDGGGQIQWQRLYGGSSWDYGASVRQTTDNGYFLLGHVSSSVSGDVTGTNHGYTDLWSVKLDGGGEIQWQRLLGGSDNEYAGAALPIADGGCLLLGASRSPANGNVTGPFHGGMDLWVVKLDGLGEIRWQRLLGGSGNDAGYSVQQTADGGYVLLGDSWSSASGNVTGTNHGFADIWVVKLDPAGAVEWDRLLGGNMNEEGGSIQVAADGEYILLGDSRSSENGDVTGINRGGFGGYDLWVVKLKADGGPAVRPVPPSTQLPTDTNADGKYEDVNGNTRADFADVVLYFNQMIWISTNETVSAFDYNGNGRIDFADVVWLFNHL
jgi:PKD repeat protein